MRPTALLSLLSVVVISAPSLLPAQPASSPFTGLSYRSIGPAAGGRLTRVAGIPGDPTTYYAATASGGVWKSTDGGYQWFPIFDDAPVSSIGSIAVAPSDPNVVYVGSGEANIRGNVAAGNGIYVSKDAGKTWSHAWKQEGQIGTVTVHPTNPDIAFAAVLGRAFGPNPERGVYRTTDGGKTWVRVLFQDVNTGASDVAIDRTNPRVIFAGFWQARRYPWDLQSGGPGSGLWVSRDGGETWTRLAGNGLPPGIWGKVGVAVAPSDGRRVYALVEADSGGLFRSEDGGATWSPASRDRAIRQRAWYYTTLTVDPTNPDHVWLPQVSPLRSIDGGKTLSYLRGYHHGDFHDFWIDPLDPRRIISADDGGPEISLDGGATWRQPMLPISQFYHVSVDGRRPYHVAGAMQDLGTAQCPSNSLYSGGIALSDCHYVGGGEAGHVLSHPADPDIVYAGEYLGIWTRYDHRTGETRNISRWPDNPSGWAGEQMRYRFQWTAAAALSPHDPNVIYHAAQMIFRSTDGGQTWATISGDLTRNDRSKQQWTGGPITGDGTGVETYGTVFAIAESPRAGGVIWAGSDDGLVHLTRDGGTTWSNVTAAMPGFPEWGTVSLIEPSPHDAAAAYVVVDRHRLDDNKPYLYKTTDYGRTWRRLDRGLAQDIYLHAVREDPTRPGLLYLGTERSVMVSHDDGNTWQSLRLNLPTVAVHDLVVTEHDLVVATHGRSIWILDDLTPVRIHGRMAGRGNLTLYQPPPAIQWHHRAAHGRPDGGSNPPAGVTFTYHLAAAPSAGLRAEIVDRAGTVIRTLRSEPAPQLGIDDDEAFRDPPRGALAADTGLHRATWDFRHEGAARIRNGKIDSGDPSRGPMALPGPYLLRLIAGRDTATTPLEVAADPRDSTSAAEREAQLAFALGVRDEITRVTTMVEHLQALQRQLAGLIEPLAGREELAPLVRLARSAGARARALEATLHNPDAEVTYDILAQRGGARVYSRLAPLQNWASEGTGAPTQGMREVFATHRAEVDAAAGELAAFLRTDIAALNVLAAERGVPWITVRP